MRLGRWAAHTDKDKHANRDRQAHVERARQRVTQREREIGRQKPQERQQQEENRREQHRLGALKMTKLTVQVALKLSNGRNARRFLSVLSGI